MTMRDVLFRHIIRKHRARLARRKLLLDLLADVNLMFRAYLNGQGEQLFWHYRDVCRALESQLAGRGARPA